MNFDFGVNSVDSALHFGHRGIYRTRIELWRLGPAWSAFERKFGGLTEPRKSRLALKTSRSFSSSAMNCPVGRSVLSGRQCLVEQVACGSNVTLLKRCCNSNGQHFIYFTLSPLIARLPGSPSQKNHLDPNAAFMGHNYCGN